VAVSELDPLLRHLAARAEAGRVLTLWWRDDDLETASDRLDACLDALGEAGVVPAFAAIPDGLREDGIAALRGSAAPVLVHGWSHANHAPAGEKKGEFGAHRPLDDRLQDVARGLTRLQAMAGDRARAWFVPPWNRVAPDILPHLRGIGIEAVSAFASRSRAPAPASVARLDTHVDLIDWRGSGGPVSVSALVEAICRQDGVDGPVGILSHHRVTDRGAWSAWRPVLRVLSDHSAARWLEPARALAHVRTQAQERRTG
jgi:hypothetical protein